MFFKSVDETLVCADHPNESYWTVLSMDEHSLDFGTLRFKLRDLFFQFGNSTLLGVKRVKIFLPLQINKYTHIRIVTPRQEIVWKKMMVNVLLKKKTCLSNQFFHDTLGLTAENTAPSSLTVSWDPVQTVKRGEQIEYLLQSQCVGKDQDFVQVSQSVKRLADYYFAC